jgi:predicted nucleotide-binding protein
VYVVYRNEKGSPEALLDADLDEAFIKRRIAFRYMRGQSLLICGRIIELSQLLNIAIFRSEEVFTELVLPDGKRASEELNVSIIAEYFNRAQVVDVFCCTHEFITSPPDRKHGDIKFAEVPFVKKDKVFIGHGRGTIEALELQKYLKEDLKVDAKLFEDLKKESGCRTITELLEYFKDNVGYAFIVFTPDDYGCLSKDLDDLKNSVTWNRGRSKVEAIQEICNSLHRRGRQNVVFELGLFIGALGRERVCCLLQESVADTPSNMDGVLHESFDRSVSEKFSAICEKLRAIGLIER